MNYKLPQKYRKLSQGQRREVRNQYIIEQHGLCYHCGRGIYGSPSEEIKKKKIKWSLFPRGRGFLDFPVHLHHDHRSGLTIGAVHALCNAVLWQYHGE